MDFVDKTKKIMILAVLFFSVSSTVKAKELTQKQKEIAERITDVCTEEWYTYGVLPSVCIGQAFVESTLGEHCNGNNLWGIKSGAESYSSLEAGVYRYMQVINNGYYRNAPFQTSPYKQIRYILAGGYCQPVGDYYSSFCYLLENYNLRDYDSKLFKKLEKKKIEKRRKKIFTIICSDTIPKNAVVVSDKVAKKGCLEIIVNNQSCGLYDIKCKKGIKDNVIYINNKNQPKYCKIRVYDNAKG